MLGTKDQDAEKISNNAEGTNAQCDETKITRKLKRKMQLKCDWRKISLNGINLTFKRKRSK